MRALRTRLADLVFFVKLRVFVDQRPVIRNHSVARAGLQTGLPSTLLNLTGGCLDE